MSIRIDLTVIFVEEDDVRLDLHETYPGMLTAYPGLVAAVRSIETTVDRLQREMFGSREATDAEFMATANAGFDGPSGIVGECSVCGRPWIGDHQC